MTQHEVNKAYPALMRLSESRLPVKKARGLYEVTKKAEEHFQFAIAEERKYIVEFNGQERPDGTVSFASPEDFAKYQEKMTELNTLEVEWDIEPVVLTEAEIGEQPISPADIHSLEGFVTFE